MGQPWASQNSASPGSSLFRSMLAAAADGLGRQARVCASKRRERLFQPPAARCPCGSPRPAPRCGARGAAPRPAAVHAVSAKSAASGVAGRAPPRRGPCPRHWPGADAAPDGAARPAAAPLTRLMRSGSRTAQPCALAQRSTAKRPLTSVAVVMTGTAPQTSASARASAFAPAQMARQQGHGEPPALVHSHHRRVAGLASADKARRPGRRCPQLPQK